jgi:hypothetical protein
MCPPGAWVAGVFLRCNQFSPVVQTGRLVFLPVHINTIDAPGHGPSTIRAPSMSGGNAGTYSGVNYALADIIDSFSVYRTDLSGGNPQSRTLDASAFVDVDNLAELIAVVERT